MSEQRDQEMRWKLFSVLREYIDSIEVAVPDRAARLRELFEKIGRSGELRRSLVQESLESRYVLS